MTSNRLDFSINSIFDVWHNRRWPLPRVRGGAATPADAVSDANMRNATDAVFEAADIETEEKEAEDEQLTGQKFAEIVDEVPPEKRRIHRIEQMLQIFKILFFMVVWLAMTYFLMKTLDNLVSKDLVTLPAAGAELEHDVQWKPKKNLAGIRLRGPFLPQINDSMYHEPLMFDAIIERAVMRVTVPKWVLKVSVLERVDGTKRKPLSEEWEVELADPATFDDVEQINRDYIFELNNYDYNHWIKFLFSTNDAVKSEIAVELYYDNTPVPETWGIFWGLTTLIIFYMVLLTDRVNRILAAMIASTAIVSILASNMSRPSMDLLMSWIEVNMLMMIFGITIIMGSLVQTGVFDWIAVYSYQIFNGHIWPPINALCIITFLLCCVFDKMVVVLMIAPIVIRLCEVMQVHPVPVFTCIICFSNVGSIWTLTAAEENALINTHKYLKENGVSHLEFITHMLPGVLLVCIQTYLQLRLNFRGIRDLIFRESPEVMKMQRLIKTLKRTADTMGAYSKDEKAVKKSLLSQIRRMRVKVRAIAKVDKPREDYASTLASLKALYPLRDKVLLVKCGIVLLLVLILFLLSTMTTVQYLTIGWIALLGALLLLILSDMEDMEAVMLRVEWGTCMFLATFFIFVQGLVRLGLTKAIGEWTVDAVLYFSPENRFTAAIFIVLWISGISSIFICSVPIANTMIHVSVTLATHTATLIPLQPLVWALTFGTCLGNNGTLISGFSNVVCAGIVEHHGYKFRFNQFLKVCFPITIGGLLTASFYLWVSHTIAEWH